MKPAPATPLPSAPRRFSRGQLWQAAAATLVAGALYLAARQLPTGTNLSHLDFRAEGKSALEYCDPNTPQFVPVSAVRSPVEMTLFPERIGPDPVRFKLTLRTTTGKPLDDGDLALQHERKLHLLVVDPSLGDYRHVHPEPGAAPGEWTWDFTPRRAGRYRVFADFMPTATGRGLYASADFEVTGAAALPWQEVSVQREQDGYRYRLELAEPLRAGRSAPLGFSVSKLSGGDVPLRPIMGALAHLVAFDERRDGFAHLHPQPTEATRPMDPQNPRLAFQIEVPRPGLYTVWAQVELEGSERFVPFVLRADE